MSGPEGGDLAIVNTEPTTTKTFEITGLNEVFTVVGTRDDASGSTSRLTGRSAAPLTLTPAPAERGPMTEYSRTELVVETTRHRITGTITLPRDGYRSRVSDVLNAAERDFISMTDVTVEPVDGSGEPERHAFVVLNRHQIVFAVVSEGDAPPPADERERPSLPCRSPLAGPSRRGAGVVERARLEIVCALTRTEGSNPSLSAAAVLSLRH